MNSTSLEAYAALLEDGTINIQESKILKILDYPMTSREVCRIADLERSSVTGRLNSLCDKKLVKEHDIVKCKITGRNVHRYSRVFKGMKILLDEITDSSLKNWVQSKCIPLGHRCVGGTSRAVHTTEVIIKTLKNTIKLNRDKDHLKKFVPTWENYIKIIKELENEKST